MRYNGSGNESDSKWKRKWDQLEVFGIEEFVRTPTIYCCCVTGESLSRKTYSEEDFIHIYEIVEDLYSVDNVRPDIDPDKGVRS